VAALYIASALAELFRFDGFDARVRVAPEGFDAHTRWLLVVIANGQWFGGSFRIAPGARLDDGRLDLVLVGNAGAWRRMRLFLAAPFGRHVTQPGVSCQRAAGALVEADVPAACELDGERHALDGRLATIDVRPSALVVVR
jgi:diacylglycerol kinase (ATP)